MYCAASFVTFLGIYTREDHIPRYTPLSLIRVAVLTYVGVSATSLGISSEFSFYFVAIANASSFFGRYTGGNLSDRLGEQDAFSEFSQQANGEIQVR